MLVDHRGDGAEAMIRASFRDQGIAKLDRLNQDLGQKACSSADAPPDGPPDAAAFTPNASSPEDYCNLGSKISRTDSLFKLDRPSHELSQDEDGELAGSANAPG